MSALLVVIGVGLIVFAFVDLVNTLVSTGTSARPWWPSRALALAAFGAVRWVASRFGEESRTRELLLTGFGPLLLLGLLAMWVLMQLVGFAFVWWGSGEVSGLDGFGDALYYSGVVFFTVGFGEIVPDGSIPRAGAIVEAGIGVVTTALVVGYLPSLYSAYSDRERQLIRLDDGSGDRITPTNLVLAWAPTGDAAELDARFGEWEEWVAAVHETHSSLPMLPLFRSHDAHQNWVTALGVLCDAAVHAQIIEGASDGSAYWFLRRADNLFRDMTEGVDLTRYVEDHADAVESGEREFFEPLYRELGDHGFDLLPYDEARRHAIEIRAVWAPRMEYLIDYLMCPRGFWSVPSEIMPSGRRQPRPDRTTEQMDEEHR